MAITSTMEALGALGVTPDTLSPGQKESLDKDGLCVIETEPAFWREFGVDLDEMAKTIDDLFEREGFNAGWEHIKEAQKVGSTPEAGARRLSNLINKHPIFRRAMVAPFPLAASYRVIKDEIRLTSLQIREPEPNAGNQALHIDWRPRHWPTAPFGACASFLYLDDSSRETGALRFVPRSHLKLGQPEDYCDPYEEQPDQVVIEVPRGAMVCLNAHTWHGGTHSSGGRRRALFITYRNRRHWQQLNQKKFLDPNVKDSLSEAEAYLLGVRNQDATQNEFFYRRRNSRYIRFFSFARDWVDAHVGGERTTHANSFTE